MSLPDALPWRLHGRAVQNQVLGQVASVQIPAMPQTPRTVTIANPICPNLLSQLPPLYRVGASCLASSRDSQHGTVGIGKYCLSACTEACLSPVAAIPENCLRCSCLLVCLYGVSCNPVWPPTHQIVKDDPEWLLLLPLFPHRWGYRYLPLYLVYEVLGTEPCVFNMSVKHSPI